MPVSYQIDGYFEYTRDGSTPTIFVETDGVDPFSGTPLFVSQNFTLTDDGTEGYQLGEDVSGDGNEFRGVLGVQVNGVNVDFLLLTWSTAGVPDNNTFLLVVPAGVDPADVTLPRTFNENTDLKTDTFFCFAEGTRIATTIGEVAVEALSCEHEVMTSDGRAVPVSFVG